MKILAVGPAMTLEYSQWRDQRINENIPASNPETARSLEEHLQVLPSEIEIIKQEFEKRSLELGKKIEQLEEKNTVRTGCGHLKIRGRQIEKRKEQDRRRFRQPEDGLQEVA
ncbi:hypothetical protein Gotur_023767 [Gossypium turneri]